MHNPQRVFSVPELRLRLTLVREKQPRSRQLLNLYQHCEPPSKGCVSQQSFKPRRRSMAATKSGGSKRGFAAMDPAKQREIASKGGKASHGGGRKASGHR
jgi:general stress protein YciG